MKFLFTTPYDNKMQELILSVGDISLAVLSGNVDNTAVLNAATTCGERLPKVIQNSGTNIHLRGFLAKGSEGMASVGEFASYIVPLSG